MEQSTKAAVWSERANHHRAAGLWGLMDWWCSWPRRAGHIKKSWNAAGLWRGVSLSFNIMPRHPLITTAHQTLSPSSLSVSSSFGLSLSLIYVSIYESSHDFEWFSTTSPVTLKMNLKTMFPNRHRDLQQPFWRHQMFGRLCFVFFCFLLLCCLSWACMLYGWTFGCISRRKNMWPWPDQWDWTCAAILSLSF